MALNLGLIVIQKMCPHNLQWVLTACAQNLLSSALRPLLRLPSPTQIRSHSTSFGDLPCGINVFGGKFQSTPTLYSF